MPSRIDTTSVHEKDKRPCIVSRAPVSASFEKLQRIKDHIFKSGAAPVLRLRHRMGNEKYTFMSHLRARYAPKEFTLSLQHKPVENLPWDSNQHSVI